MCVCVRTHSLRRSRIHAAFYYGRTTFPDSDLSTSQECYNRKTEERTHFFFLSLLRPGINLKKNLRVKSNGMTYWYNIRSNESLSGSERKKKAIRWASDSGASHQLWFMWNWGIEPDIKIPPRCAGNIIMIRNFGNVSIVCLCFWLSVNPGAPNGTNFFGFLLEVQRVVAPGWSPQVSIWFRRCSRRMGCTITFSTVSVHFFSFFFLYYETSSVS